MKAKDIVIGRVYAVKVSGTISPVRVDSVRERWDHLSHRILGKTWTGTNMRTNRKVTIYSPIKFRYEVHRVDGKWRSA